MGGSSPESWQRSLSSTHPYVYIYISHPSAHLFCALSRLASSHVSESLLYGYFGRLRAYTVAVVHIPTGKRSIGKRRCWCNVIVCVVFEFSRGAAAEVSRNEYFKVACLTWLNAGRCLWITMCIGVHREVCSNRYVVGTSVVDLFHCLLWCRVIGFGT